MANDYIFLYWDDCGDSQEHVDNQKKEMEFQEKERDYFALRKNEEVRDVFDDDDTDPDA